MVFTLTSSLPSCLEMSLGSMLGYARTGASPVGGTTITSKAKVEHYLHDALWPPPLGMLKIGSSSK